MSKPTLTVTQRREAFEVIWRALDAYNAGEITLVERNALTEPARASLRISGGMTDNLLRGTEHGDHADGALYYVKVERDFFDKERAEFAPQDRRAAVQAFADACCDPAKDDCTIYLCYYSGGCIDPAIQVMRKRA